MNGTGQLSRRELLQENRFAEYQNLETEVTVNGIDLRYNPRLGKYMAQVGGRMVTRRYRGDLLRIISASNLEHAIPALTLNERYPEPLPTGPLLAIIGLEDGRYRTRAGDLLREHDRVYRWDAEIVQALNRIRQEQTQALLEFQARWQQTVERLRPVTYDDVYPAQALATEEAVS